MRAEQMMRIAVAFARTTALPNARLCAACVDVLEVAGAGITLMGGDHAGPLCVSNERMAALEDLQFTAGEGPCRDAFVSRMPVAAASLDSEAWDRWPAFIDLAIATGVGAVFAYPLSMHGAAVGVLTVYQDAAGALTSTQHDDSVALAEVLAETLLGLQSDAPDNVLSPGLEAAVVYRAQIHQASGMVAIQLQVSAGEALARIRAYAFAHDRTIDVVAADIVGRRLRLDDDRHQESHQE
jgi:ANTAR domain